MLTLEYTYTTEDFNKRFGARLRKGMTDREMIDSLEGDGIYVYGFGNKMSELFDEEIAAEYAAMNAMPGESGEVSDDLSELEKVYVYLVGDVYIATDILD